MIAIAPGDDAWGFLVSVYHYQAGRERERCGAADPYPSSFLEMFYHDPKADPCPPFFQEKPKGPLSTGGGFDPYPFPEKLIPEKWVAPRVYTRVYA